MASFNARQRDPLLDQTTQAMVEKRGKELLGLLLIVFAVVLSLMLGSYSPDDPGWMVASDHPAENIFGRLGAAVSSTLTIIIGLGAWSLPVLLAVWGLRFLLHRGQERVVSRAIFGWVLVIVASAYASTHAPSGTWVHSFGLGGLFGDTILGMIVGGLPDVLQSAGLKISSLVLAVAMLAAAAFTLGFDAQELRAIGRFLLFGTVVIYSWILAGMRLLGINAAHGAVGLGQRLKARQVARRTAAAEAAAPRAEASGLSPRIAALRQSPAQGASPAASPVVVEADEAPAAPRASQPSRIARYDSEPPLSAAPRSADATRSLRARVESLIRRAPEPEPELVEPLLIEHDVAAPSDERIRSRISDAIRAKARMVAAPAAVSGRSEPPVQRNARPDVEIAPAVSRAVAAAQARAAAGVVAPRVAPSHPVVRPVVAAAATAVLGGAAQAAAAASPARFAAEESPTFDGFDAWDTGELIETPLADDLPPEAYGDFDAGWEMTAAERHAADLREDEGAAALGVDEDAALLDELDALDAARAAPPVARAPEYVPRVLARASAESTAAPLAADFDAADFDSAEYEADDYGADEAFGDDDRDAALEGDDGDDDGFDAWQGHAAPVAAASRAPMVAPDIRRGGAPAAPLAARPPLAPARAPAAEPLRPHLTERPAPPYEAPPLALLTDPTTIERHHLSDEALEDNARMLENVLEDYGVKGEIVSVRPGPVVTMYELEPAPGLKASRVIGLADDIARSMSALSARVSTVPGRSVIGIELPNHHREKVVLREIITARDFGDSNMRLPLALGKDIGGEPIIANLAKMPHLLIAGTTGSGKSVAINTMILSLLYKLTPEECRLIMIDPKMLELSVYDGIPHLLSPVVTDPKKAVVALKWAVGEMEERYRKMSKMGVRNIEGYNGRVREALAKGEMFKRTIQTGFDDETGDPVFETDEFAPQPFPYIVVIVDEMADLMMVAGKEIEACIQRLAQMARASGIHLIMATQRPSVDVITGTIKANFPTRISFQVTSKIDSRTILGEMGAEQLLGMGDMLYMAGGGRVSRIHGPFVSDEEVEEIVTHLKSFGPPAYMSGVVDGPDEDRADDIDQVLGLGGGETSEDALYDQAVAIVARDRKCSTSYIQRKLGIGYQKAARLVEQMEDQGVVSTANHVGKREILLPEH